MINKGDSGLSGISNASGMMVSVFQPFGKHHCNLRSMRLAAMGEALLLLLQQCGWQQCCEKHCCCCSCCCASAAGSNVRSAAAAAMRLLPFHSWSILALFCVQGSLSWGSCQLSLVHAVCLVHAPFFSVHSGNEYAMHYKKRYTRL